MMPRSPFIQMRKPVAEAFGSWRELQSVSGPPTSRHRAREGHSVVTESNPVEIGGPLEDCGTKLN